MKGNFKATSALAILTTTTIEAPKVKTFGAAVVAEFENIGRQERANAVRAVLVGLGFHAIKAALKHGEFTPWLQSNVNRVNIWSKATARVNASYYMRLAIAFVEQAKPSRPELLALTAAGEGALNLEQSKGEAAKLFSRVEKFVGERSLNEILIDEGIKGGGSSGGGSSAPAALPTGDDPLLADTAQHLMGLRALLLDPENVKRFTARQLEDIEQQWASGLDQFRKLLAKLRA